MAKLDIYQAVTDRILEALDKGTVPWRHPITPGKGQDGIPKSLASGKAYRGINVFLLAMTAWAQGYSSDYWLTYKQAKQQGGQVRKGEKSSLVVFWKRYVTEDKESGEDRVLPVIRHYNVFNAEQCDGIETPEQDSGDGAVGKENGEPVPAIEACERVIDGYQDGPIITSGGSQAFYAPLTDSVQIPLRERFESAERYYATYFHELVHSTGHSSRLDRKLDKKLAPFGSADYSKEELIAEMGAAFLAASTGISPPTIELSAAYIDNWRRKLRGDKKLVIQAAGAGQRAADHILGVTWDEANEATQRGRAVGKGSVRSVSLPEDREHIGSTVAPEVWEKVKDDLQSFPRPGIANLNSTATQEQRSKYIRAVLGWWNGRYEHWEEQGVIDPKLNPVVIPDYANIQSSYPGQRVYKEPDGVGGPS